MIAAVFAAVADIHGNRWALEAVLADARGRGAKRLFNLGDSLYGPLDPAGTAERLLAADLPVVTVRGNEDRVLLDPAADPRDHPSLPFTRSRLARRHLDWLAGLPTTATCDDLLLCHGTPERDDIYLLEEVTGAGAQPRTPEGVADLLGGTTASLILCGHSHTPRLTRLPRGGLAVNPGSVGLPAYREETPFPHTMETGSPHARYALIVPVEGGWSVELVAVAYDWESAAGTATANGRADWAAALRTGRA